MAERCSVGANPLYYEMKKAKAELLTNQSLYDGLKLAFTGGNIGGISNNITKIWNSGEITEEALKVVMWLCMEVNFTIDYAKTLFKPTRPKDVDIIIKQYTKQKVPHFFKYAKDKADKQIEIINECTVNKIVHEIKDNKQLFTGIKQLADINYLYMLPNKEDNYSNDKLNKAFDIWNKQYGYNLRIDEDNTDKNNIAQIVAQIKSELRMIEPDDDKILCSLVGHLYKSKSSRKKKLLWYMYGEKLYNNIKINTADLPPYCTRCGRREEFNSRGYCHTCASTIKYRIIKCCDCGCDVEATHNRTIRCNECSIIARKIKKAESERKSGHLLLRAN